MEKITFKIKSDFIELIKLLKASGLASTGGMAKMIVSEGLVKVNGETESRMRRKVLKGDVVDCEGTLIEVN